MDLVQLLDLVELHGVRLLLRDVLEELLAHLPVFLQVLEDLVLLVEEDDVGQEEDDVDRDQRQDDLVSLRL